VDPAKKARVLGKRVLAGFRIAEDRQRLHTYDGRDEGDNESSERESITQSIDGEEPSEIEVDFHTSFYPGLSRSDPRLCGRDYRRQISSILTRAEPSLVRHSYSTRLATVDLLNVSRSCSHGRCILAKASRPVNSKSGVTLFLYLYVPPRAYPPSSHSSRLRPSWRTTRMSRESRTK